jgi:hypothetical protein
MRLPGFTASAVLVGSARRDWIVPAIPPGGGNPEVECLSDCVELKCPKHGLSGTACSSFCRTTCHSGIDQGPTGPNTVNCRLCQGAQAAWKAACEATLGPVSFVCRFIPFDCPACS